eukprot:5438619-Karenia_brevis.AAC.1
MCGSSNAKALSALCSGIAGAPKRWERWKRHSYYCSFTGKGHAFVSVEKEDWAATEKGHACESLAKE